MQKRMSKHQNYLQVQQEYQVLMRTVSKINRTQDKINFHI